MKQLAWFCLILCVAVSGFIPGAWADVTIYFDQPLQEWDGFGVNYVETAQTFDYDEWPQEYGGFSILPEGERQRVLRMIFGEDGLRPALVKMFLDPWHEGLTAADNDNEDPDSINMEGYDHASTTQWMRYFVREGLQLTRDRGDDLSIITTLYGPPAWMTEQKIIRGRDLDQGMKYECAEYMISWAKYLRNEEGFPVRYLSLHNEGESEYRWLRDGTTEEGSGHDYNIWWPPDQVVDFLGFMRGMLDSQDMQDVGLTPGETTQWHRFLHQRYAAAIANNAEAVENIGLITSHGFSWGELADQHITPRGIEVIRERRPDIDAWTTSMSWFDMDVEFMDAIRKQIYVTGVNAIIPWACIQTNTWKGGDPNPGTAIFVNGAGRVEIRPGYYMYKQICPVGQPGMRVAAVETGNAAFQAIAFAAAGTDNPDAFVLLNLSDDKIQTPIRLSGSSHQRFGVRRTIVFANVERAGEEEHYTALDDAVPVDGIIEYIAPARSVTTFTGE